MSDWNGQERRLNQDKLLKDAAREGAREVLRELGISEEDQETIKGFLKIVNGAKATRSLIIWIAGFLTALASLYYIVIKFFDR